MTSLNYGIDMPYEVQLEHDAATSPGVMIILEPQRSPDRGAGQHYLTPGVYMVSLSYNGAQRATLRHYVGGVTTNTVEVPAGIAGTPRTSAPIKISVQDTNEYLQVSAAASTGGSARATISVIPAATFDEMAESEQGVSVLSEIANLKNTKADQSVIDGATYQVGRADTTWANRLVKLNQDGKIFIATNSIINDSDPVNKSYVDKVAPIPAFAGTGSPEGRVAASVGTVYTDTAATNGAIRWIKTAGTGSTGWKVEYGDTGWRSLPIASGSMFVRRVGSTAEVRLQDFRPEETGTIVVTSMPSGFRPRRNVPTSYFENSAPRQSYVLSYAPFHFEIRGITTIGAWITAQSSFLIDEAWPTSLPGTPA